MIAAGAPINQRDRCGFTPISYAICFGQDASVVEVLIDHGADLSNREENGLTPLMQAVKHNSYACLKLLLRKDKEWDRSAATWRENTILHIAAVHADAETLKILSSEYLAGVEFDRRNSADKTAEALFDERPEPDEATILAFDVLLRTVREQESKAALSLDEKAEALEKVGSSEEIFSGNKGDVLVDVA
jgi:ankyrin repeat protein